MCLDNAKISQTTDVYVQMLIKNPIKNTFIT